MACCRLHTQVANTPGTEDGDQRTSHRVVRSEGAAPGTRVLEPGCVEGIACFAVVGESVAHHQGILRINLVVELSRCFGFRSRDREEAGIELAGLQSGESASRQKIVNGCGHRRIYVGAVLATVTLLLESRMKERAVLNEGS